MQTQKDKIKTNQSVARELQIPPLGGWGAEFITDLDGIPHQYFWYSPWGEALKDQKSNTNAWESPYAFNGKELDEETGLYYYGARYYNPQISVWLSVDPLCHLSPNQTPYHFVSNNPIMRIDPDGRKDGFFEKLGNWISGDGWNTNREIADAEWQKKWVEAGNVVLDNVDVVSSKPKAKQKYGEPVWGSSDEQLLETPEAENIGESQEMFPMRGAPGKSSGNFAQKLAKGLNILKKWVSWGVKDTPPGTPPSTQETETPIPPVPQVPEPNTSSRDVYYEDYKFGDEKDSLMNRYYYSRDPNGTSSNYDSVKYNYYKKKEYGKK